MTMVGTEMEIRYTMTVEDIRRLWRFTFRRWPGTPATFILSMPGCLVLFGAIFAFAAGDPLVVLEWWMVAGAFLLGAGFLWIAYVGVAAMAQKTPGALGSYWLRITPTGIEERTPLTDEMVMWPRIQEVVATRHAIYIIPAPNRAYLAPRRAFATPDEADAFLNLARGYWQAARESVAAAHTDPSDRDRAA